MAAVVQERVFTLSEVPAMVDFLFLEDPPIDPDSWQKAIGRDEVAPAILSGALDAYATCEWRRDKLHGVTAQIGEANGRALGKAQAPIRVAVTGKRVGPPLFESLEVLGRDETRRRIAAALDRLRLADLMLFGPIRLDSSHPRPLGGGHRRLFRGQPGAGLVDVTAVQTPSGRGDHGDGGGAIQRSSLT